MFITIALLSIAGLTLIIQGFIKNRANRSSCPKRRPQRIREMIEARKFKELIEFTETDPSFVSQALNPALKRAPSFSSMKEAMETAIGEQTAEQFRRIEYLNIIGNLGPLLGPARHGAGDDRGVPGDAGHGRPGGRRRICRSGISTALTHTFLGLFLAVPCLAAFGVLRTIVDRLTVRGALVAEELLLMIKPAEAKPAVPRGVGNVPVVPRRIAAVPPAPTSPTLAAAVQRRQPGPSAEMLREPACSTVRFD